MATTSLLLMHPATKLLRLHRTGTWPLKHGQAVGTRLGSGSYPHKLLSNQLHVPLRPRHFQILCRHLRIMCHPLPGTNQLGGYDKLHGSCLYGRLLWYPGERFKLRWTIFHLQGFRKVNASPPKQLRFILHTTNRFKCLEGHYVTKKSNLVFIPFSVFHYMLTLYNPDHRSRDQEKCLVEILGQAFCGHYRPLVHTLNNQRCKNWTNRAPCH
jgi:hypothetical protein